MRVALQRAWRSRGPFACLLWPVSLLYGALAALHRNLYRWGVLRVEHAGIPVLVVGNVVAGGAGKTPVVIALAHHFTGRGVAVGVVSRGYGRQGDAVLEVRHDSAPSETGDEPLLIARRTGVPVVVARRRIDAVRALRAAHPGVQLILCDDGLQHHALHRDVELCVFDERGTGNGWLLPAGPLREPWPRRADLVLRAGHPPGVDGHPVTRALESEAVRADGTRVPLAQLAGTTCHAVAGIAQPERFFDMLRAAGLQLASTRALPDHHDFSGTQLPRLEEGALLCTEKDLVKLGTLAPHALAVPLRVELTPACWDELDARVLPKLSSADGSQTA